MWCRNNLDKVGKWAEKTGSLAGVIIAVFIFIEIFSLNAYALDTLTLPINDLVNEAVKGLRLNQNMNMGTEILANPIKDPFRDIDISVFFGSSSVSSNDITSFFKEAVVTGVRLSILIVSIITDILKGILNAFKE